MDAFDEVTIFLIWRDARHAGSEETRAGGGAD